jgi:nucleotide-binding universal stress UspA family protein
MEFKKILCPVDLSDISRESLRKAVGLAQQYGAELLVAHVVSSAAWLSPPLHSMSINISEYQEKIHQSSSEALGRLVAEVVPGQLQTEVILQTGDPSHMISELADEKEVDLIVMSSRENTALGRFIFGSVAERVLRSVSCPVLVLKEKD